MQHLQFDIAHACSASAARAGTLHTAHGKIETPIFMPVGTLGTVKAVHQRELSEDVKAQIILGNTYHLYLRPGMEVIAEAGGLHKFMNWQKPLLTDSGGYQIFSLANNRKLTEEGAQFQSHIDGSRHFFSPEKIVDIQRTIGADIMMAFDECPALPSTEDTLKKSMNLTHRWLERCINAWEKTEPKYGFYQALFPIVQGGTDKILRQESAHFVANLAKDGAAIGGLSVGEPKEEMYSMVDVVNSILPKKMPRYLMGVGKPENILENIALGVDMFDCVMPTRNGRNGMLFTKDGIINIKNKKWGKDFSAIDADSKLFADSQYSKAYLRHLFQAEERLAGQIASLHNLYFYLWLVKTARQKIIDNTFVGWKQSMVKRVATRL